MKKEREIESYSDVPWVPATLQEEVAVSAANEILRVLKNNHIKRNQTKQIFDIVDMVVQDTEI